MQLKDVIIAKTKTDAEEKIAAITAASDANAEKAAAAARVEMQTLVDEATELYQSELIKRKKIHNKLVEIQGNIRVFCRVRPIVPVELASGEAR